MSTTHLAQQAQLPPRTSSRNLSSQQPLSHKVVPKKARCVLAPHCHPVRARVGRYVCLGPLSGSPLRGLSGSSLPPRARSRGAGCVPRVDSDRLDCRCHVRGVLRVRALCRYPRRFYPRRFCLARREACSRARHERVAMLWWLVVKGARPRGWLERDVCWRWHFPFV